MTQDLCFESAAIVIPVAGQLGAEDGKGGGWEDIWLQLLALVSQLVSQDYYIYKYYYYCC